MKGEQELFDRIREEAKTLAPQPSARAWRRLESRLDARRRRHRVSLYRSLGMVAAVLALVVMLSLLAVVLDRAEDRRLIGQRLQDTPKHLQDLPIPDNSPRVIRVMEYNRSFQHEGFRTIEEGDPTKKLMPARPM